MALPHTFAAQTAPTMAELDDNFAALGALTPIACSVTGTNALALTPLTDTPTVSAYSNYMQFVGVAANANTAAATAAVGGLSALPIYKDTRVGPAVLTGAEIAAGSTIILTYDSALNTGSGGFHLQCGSSVLQGQTIVMASFLLSSGGSIAGAYLLHQVTRQATLTHTVIPANTTQDQSATLAGVLAGDLAQVVPPASCATVAGLLYTAFVPAAGTITVRLANVTASSIVPPTSQVFRLIGLGYSE